MDWLNGGYGRIFECNEVNYGCNQSYGSHNRKRHVNTQAFLIELGVNFFPGIANHQGVYWSAADRSAQVQLVADDGFAAWDEFIERRRTHTFCLSAMSFQDAWTLDMERLRQCKVHIASPNGMLVPFCAYNLTNQLGEAIYRGQVG